MLMNYKIIPPVKTNCRYELPAHRPNPEQKRLSTNPLKNKLIMKNPSSFLGVAYALINWMHNYLTVRYIRPFVCA